VIAGLVCETILEQIYSHGLGNTFAMVKPNLRFVVRSPNRVALESGERALLLGSARVSDRVMPLGGALDSDSPRWLCVRQESETEQHIASSCSETKTPATRVFTFHLDDHLSRLAVRYSLPRGNLMGALNAPSVTSAN
jgi:hypothetical protein